MNGQSTLRISTFHEAQNHSILGLLFLPLFSSVINEYTLWYLMFLEDILVVLMWMSILSLPHSYNINSNSCPTLTYSNIFLLPADFLCFLVYSFNVNISATLRYFNLFLFTIFSFQFFVFYLNITFSLTLTQSNIFLLATSCFTP